MALIIRVKLDMREVKEGAQETHRALSAQEQAHRRRMEAIANEHAAKILEIERRSQDHLDTIKQRSLQQAAAHQQRIEALHTQSASRIQQIESRKQAQLDVIRERAVQKEIEQQRRLERAAQSGAGGFQAFLRRYSSTIREAGESIQQAGFAALGLTGLIVGLGRAAVQSAVDIDKQVNVLKALTGSAEQAEKRFAQLVAISQRTPGLTTSLAATLDAQLRTLSVSESTINRALPAIGRLNAISPLGDPSRFAQNLVQLVTQNFERSDLKELVGQSPLAGELIREIFNVDSPTNAKAIRESAKKLGIDTVEELFTALSTAAANNSKLQGVTESLATQFEKLRDRVIVALRPLGLTIIQTIQPLVEKAVPTIERLSKAFADLPEPVRQAIIVVAGFAAALAPVVIAIGGFIQAFGAIGSLVGPLLGAGGIAGLATLFIEFLPIILAVVAAIAALAAAFATNFAGIRDVALDIFDFLRARFIDAARYIEDHRGVINEFLKAYNDLSEELKPIVMGIADFFKQYWAIEIKAALFVAEVALRSLTFALQQVISAFRTLKNIGRESVAAVAGVANFFLDPLNQFGLNLRQRTRNALTPQPRGTGEGLDGEEITIADFARFNEQQRRIEEEEKKKREQAAKDAAEKGAAATRALREAQLRAQQDFDRNQFELLKDANERILKEEQREFDLRLIDADQFFKDKLGLLQANIGNEINLLNEQKIAAQDAFNKTKPNTAERVRLQQQIVDLQTQITIKTRELGDVEQEVFRESLKAKAQDLSLSTQEVQIIEQARSTIDLYAEAKARALGVSKEVARQQIEFNELIGNEAEQLRKNIRDLDFELKAGSANFDLKAEQARKQAILETKRADEEAVLSMVKNRERLADASIFHADQANARFLDHLARQQSVTEATADAMIKAYEGVAGSLDRGIDRLTQKLGFFGDAINSIIKSIVRNLLANVFAPTFGGGQQGGGFLSSILGGLFGPSTAGGLTGGLFRTPSTFPGGFNLNSLFSSASGGGLAAPPSVSSRLGPIPITFEAGSASTRGVGQLKLDEPFASLNKPGFFSSLRSGLGPLAPALGLSLGAGIGGQSLAGNIIGGAGGLLGGLVGGAILTGATKGVLGTFALSGALGPAALVAAPLLLAGGFLLGKAKQRRQDEEASGQMLTQALQAIDQLASGIATDQIQGSQAKAIFDNEILATFTSQIKTLQTKSVVQSRLTNQVRDLQNVYQARIPPLIAEQEQRQRNAARFAAIDSRLIPQFETGGISSGGLAILHPMEMVLTPHHQAAIRLIAGSDVFDRVGVPGIQQQAVFDRGGLMPTTSPFGAVNLFVEVIFNLSQGEMEELVARGMSGANGERITFNNVQAIRRRRNRR